MSISPRGLSRVPGALSSLWGGQGRQQGTQRELQGWPDSPADPQAQPSWLPGHALDPHCCLLATPTDLQRQAAPVGLAQWLCTCAWEGRGLDKVEAAGPPRPRGGRSGVCRARRDSHRPIPFLFWPLFSPREDVSPFREAPCGARTPWGWC